MREREEAATAELARDQNFLDQWPFTEIFAKLLERAHQSSSILLSDLRRGLICYARKSYNEKELSVRQMTAKDFKDFSEAFLRSLKKRDNYLNSDQAEQLPGLIWKVGQNLHPLVLAYIATQSGGQYLNDGELNPNLSDFFAAPLTCKVWMREKLITDGWISVLKRGGEL